MAPHHEMEARTRETSTNYLSTLILPVFGGMRINEIQPADVREWVSDLKAAGASASVIRQCHTILSAVFTTACNDQITRLHPCRGVKTPPAAKKLRTIITPEQFDQLYTALPSDTASVTKLEFGQRYFPEMRHLRYSINLTFDGCCDHRAIPADDDLHRHAVENLDRSLLLRRLLVGLVESAAGLLRRARAGRSLPIIPATGKRQRMNTTNPAVGERTAWLHIARAKDSVDKRARVFHALRTMEAADTPITAAAAARAVGVSTWLLYSDGIREHLDAARRRQARQTPTTPSSPGAGAPVGAAGLRTDLALARDEIRRLRAEGDKLRRRLRLQLGAEIDGPDRPELVTRVAELESTSRLLLADRDARAAEAHHAGHRARELEDDLTAAREGLRRVIETQDRTGPNT